MARTDDRKKKAKKVSDKRIRELGIRVLALGVVLFVLVQLTLTFAQVVFTDRFDDFEVVALRYSLKTVPFTCNTTITDYSGDRIVLLNVTAKEQSLLLYSENLMCEEFQVIGELERGERAFLVIFPSEVSDGKDYVIYGKFINLYKYGTREPTSVLHVDSFHEYGLMDNIILSNETLLCQLLIALVVLTVACVLVLVAGIILLSVEL